MADVSSRSRVGKGSSHGGEFAPERKQRPTVTTNVKKSFPGDHDPWTIDPGKSIQVLTLDDVTVFFQGERLIPPAMVGALRARIARDYSRPAGESMPQLEVLDEQDDLFISAPLSGFTMVTDDMSGQTRWLQDGCEVPDALMDALLEAGATRSTVWRVLENRGFERDFSREWMIDEMGRM